MTIEEFFGTLQESITAEWRKHLQTNKYSAHEALDVFYKEMPEKVDALIEAWQADNDIVKNYKNVLDEGMDALEYLEALKKLTKEGRELLKSSELESLCDDVLSLIDSTIYKLKHLKESMKPLADFLKESLNEAAVTWPTVVGNIQSAIDGASPAEKNKWGSILAKFQDTFDLNSLQKLIKKNKPMAIKRNDEDNKSPWVGFKTENGEVIEIEFCDGSTGVKLHQGNAEMTTHKDFYAGEGFLWTNAPGERCSVYECPSDVVKQIIDIAKTKF